MCMTTELVPIPQWLFDTGGVKMRERPGDDTDWGFDPTHPEYGFNDAGERCLRLDSCIVPAVQALWNAGIATVSCCCGHDAPHGVVSIQRPAATPPVAAEPRHPDCICNPGGPCLAILCPVHEVPAAQPRSPERGVECQYCGWSDEKESKLHALEDAKDAATRAGQAEPA